jgi:hypothetical protein
LWQQEDLLQSAVSSHRTSFELIALEALMVIAMDVDRRRAHRIRWRQSALLGRGGGGGFGGVLPRGGERQLAVLRDDLANLLAQLAATKELLAAQLEDEMQMAFMDLTYLSTHPHLARYPYPKELVLRHEAVEVSALLPLRR